MDVIDFSRSYIHWVTAAENSYARFGVQAVLKLLHQTWCLSSSVMAGNVYGVDMPKFPPYGYSIACSEESWVIFRDSWLSSIPNRTSGTISFLFKSITSNLYYSTPRCLLTFDEIVEATQSGCTLTMCAKFELGMNHYDLFIPVQHINICERHNQFQIETGPVLVPAVDEGCSAVNMAYLFCNGFDSISLLTRSDPQKAYGHWYSQKKTLQASVTLFGQ